MTSCVYKLDHTAHCAQTTHRTRSDVLSFPLWHISEALDTSRTHLAALCARWKQRLKALCFSAALLSGS